MSLARENKSICLKFSKGVIGYLLNHKVLSSSKFGHFDSYNKFNYSEEVTRRIHFDRNLNK